MNKDFYGVCCLLNSADVRSRYTHVAFAVIRIMGELLYNELWTCIVNWWFLIIFYNFWVAPVYNFVIIQNKIKLVWFYSRIIAEL